MRLGDGYHHHLPVRLSALILGCCAWLNAAPVIQHSYNATSVPKTVTSTTAGRSMVWWVASASTPTQSRITGGTGETVTPTVTYADPSGEIISIFVVKSLLASGTAITCSSGSPDNCGALNSLLAWEISGTDTTTTVDHISHCQSPSELCAAVLSGWGSGAPRTFLPFNPGYNSEAALIAYYCSGNASSFATGSWSGTSFPAGNAGGSQITSGFGVVTGAPDSGCGSTTTGVIIGIKGSGATQQCAGTSAVAADADYYGYSAESGVNTNATMTATANAGDLMVIVAWCSITCGAGTVTFGSQSAVQTSVSGNSSSTNGQARLFYILSVTTGGSATLTFAPTSTWTHAQVAYYAFSYAAGCTFTHNIDSTLGTGTGTAINTPSITPTAGDLVFNFTWVDTHITALGSSWYCNDQVTTGDCTFNATKNVDAYILGSAGTSTANSMTNLNVTDNWQGLLSSFTLAAPPAGGCTSTLMLLGAGCK